MIFSYDQQKVDDTIVDTYKIGFCYSPFAVLFGTVSAALAIEHIQTMSHRVDDCQNILGSCRRPACSTGSAGSTVP